MAELFSDIYGAVRGQEGHRSVSSDKFPREFTLGQAWNLALRLYFGSDGSVAKQA